MEAPDHDEVVAAFARRILNISKSLEQTARAGRGVIPAPALSALWRIQHLTYQWAKAVARQP